MKKGIMLGVVLLGSGLLIPGSSPAQNDEPTSTWQEQTVTMSPVDTAILPDVAVPEVKPVITAPAPVVQKPVQQPAQASAQAPVKPAAPKPPTVKTYNLYPTTWHTSDAVSQGMIDKGMLVTWTWPNPCLIAGHDTMGWHWLDDIPTGSIVVVHTGPCTGRYKVVAHRWIDGHGSPTRPSWMNGYAALQTCSGSGTGFSLMQRA